MSRKKELDVARGICIILIVLGHCFPVNFFPKGEYSWATYIYDIVYLFHVPCLFLISGYLFYKHMGKLYGTTVIGKVKRILVPYFFFSVLYIPLRYFAAGLSNSTYSTPIWQILIGNSPNGGVWFLYALFLYYLVAMVFINKNNIEPVILVSVVLYYIGRQGFLELILIKIYALE